MDDPNVLGELERLVEMNKSGLLTDEQFEAAKNQLLRVESSTQSFRETPAASEATATVSAADQERPGSAPDEPPVETRSAGSLTRGEGWWEATDGRWYPPELVPLVGQLNDDAPTAERLEWQRKWLIVLATFYAGFQLPDREFVRIDDAIGALIIGFVTFWSMSWFLGLFAKKGTLRQSTPSVDGQFSPASELPKWQKCATFASGVRMGAIGIASFGTGVNFPTDTELVKDQDYLYAVLNFGIAFFMWWFILALVQKTAQAVRALVQKTAQAVRRRRRR